MKGKSVAILREINLVPRAILKQFRHFAFLLEQKDALGTSLWLKYARIQFFSGRYFHP